MHIDFEGNTLPTAWHFDRLVRLSLALFAEIEIDPDFDSPTFEAFRSFFDAPRPLPSKDASIEDVFAACEAFYEAHFTNQHTLEHSLLSHCLELVEDWLFAIQDVEECLLW
jgi:hypothetical protein